MSLINQMLRDLDRRQDRTDGRGAVPPAYRQGRPPRRSPWLILAFAASVPLAALVGWLAWERFAAAPAAEPAPAAAVELPRSAGPARAALAATPAGPRPEAASRPVPPPPAPAGEPRARETARAPEPTPRRPAATRQAPPPAMADTEAPPPADDASPGTLHKSPRPVSPLQRAEEHYRRAYTLLSQGRQEAGEAALRKALAAAPDHEKARELLALVLIRGGRLVEAGEVLREGLRRNRGHRQLVRIYAEVLDRQQRTAVAVRLLEQYRPARIERDPAYFALLAAYYRKQGHHQDAASLYRQLTRLRPDNGVWWIGLGLSLEALAQPAAAAEAYRKALDTGALNARLRQFAAGKLKTSPEAP